MDAFDTVRMTLVATGSLCLLIALVKRFRSGPDHRCPTPRFSWVPFLAKRCWYDVTGLDECPECGRPVVRVVTARRRVRFARLGATLVLLAIVAAPVYRTWYYGRFLHLTPTPVLALAHIVWPESIHRPVELALFKRVTEDPDGLSNRAISWWYGRRFRNGEVNLRSTLRSLGPFGEDQLRAALRSPDRTVRQYAAEIIAARRIEAPDEDLMPVLIEALEDDAHWSNANDAMWYLLRHPTAARPYLEDALDDAWSQKQLLACHAAVIGELEGLDDRIIPILIGHLRDNDVSSDRRIAITLLIRIGEPALPYLESRQWAKDRQQRDTIAHVRSRILYWSDPEHRRRDVGQYEFESHGQASHTFGLGDW